MASRLPDVGLMDAPSIQPSASVSRYAPQPNQLGADIRQGGRDLMEASALIADMNARQDQVMAQDGLNRYVQKGIELQSQFAQAKGKDAVGAKFSDKWMEQYDIQQKSIADSLTDQQRVIFERRAPAVRLKYMSQLLSHQGVETDKFNTETENSQLDYTRRDMFMSYGDPEAFKAGSDEIAWVLFQRAQRLGWDDATLTDTRNKYMSLVYKDVASVMVENDPAKSLDLLNQRLAGKDTGNRVIDSLDAGNTIELQHRARGYVDRAINQNLQDLEIRTKEAQKTIEDTEKFVLEGRLISPEEQARVLGKVAGFPALTEYAKGLITASIKASEFGSKPLRQQEEILRKAEALVMQQGSDQKTEKLIDSMRTINANQAKAYKENPWRAATRFSRVAPTPEVDAAPEQIPALIEQRQEKQTAVEHYAGEVVSSLQPRESEKFAEDMKSKSLSVRGEIFGQIGDKLKRSPNRIDALATDIGKKDRLLELQLWQGSDRTTAGRTVNELMEKGAQALHDKTIKPDNADVTGWRSKLSDLVRGTLGDKKAEDRIMDASFYVLAALESKDAPRDYASAKANVENAVAMVAGMPIQRDGEKAFMPRGITNKNDFDVRAIQALQPMAGQTFYIRGEPVTSEALATRWSSYGIRMDGEGNYLPTRNGAFVTTDKTGLLPLRLKVQ